MFTVSPLALIQPASAATEPVSNGSFENFNITSGEHWQIFPSADLGNWQASAVALPGDRQGLEIQENGIYLGSTASSGTKYAELDGDYPVTLTQQLTACSSGRYLVAFDHAPRPGHNDNQLKAMLGDNVLLNTGSIAAPSSFAWTTYSGFVVDEKTGYVSLSFQETGADDSLGMFLDNVRVTCAEPVDSDNDGVNDSQDLCADTKLDTDTSRYEKQFDLGVNRWEYTTAGGKSGWYQNVPAKKGDRKLTSREGLDYTYGCNGHQILEKLAVLGNVMNGHWKFGLSSSVVQEFHEDMADQVLNGRYFIETVTVPANKSTATNSSYPMVSGTQYVLQASGTYRFADWGVFGIADAKYNYRSAAYNNNTPDWVDGSTWDSPYRNFLQVSNNGSAIGWQEEFNTDHKYTANIVGNGSPLSLIILDDYYGDNSGNILVDIYAQL